jgi:hypothetical protein
MKRYVPNVTIMNKKIKMIKIKMIFEKIEDNKIKEKDFMFISTDLSQRDKGRDIWKI